MGRVILGVGAGWNAEELANHGTEFKSRFKVMRERIAAMKAIWAEEEEAEFHGEFVNFDPVIARPKPVQTPHPPVIVGGGLPHGAKRAVEYGDGWLPVGARDLDISSLLTEFRKLARDAGRDPETLGVSVYGLNRVFVDPDEYFRSQRRDSPLSGRRRRAQDLRCAFPGPERVDADARPGGSPHARGPRLTARRGTRRRPFTGFKRREASCWSSASRAAILSTDGRHRRGAIDIVPAADVECPEPDEGWRSALYAISLATLPYLQLPVEV